MSPLHFQIHIFIHYYYSLQLFFKNFPLSIILLSSPQKPIMTFHHLQFSLSAFISLPTIPMFYAISLSSTETFLITFSILLTLLLAVYNKFHSVTEICFCSSLSSVLLFLFLWQIIFVPFFPDVICCLIFLAAQNISLKFFYPTKISFLLVLITYLLNAKISSKDLLFVYLYPIN